MSILTTIDVYTFLFGGEFYRYDDPSRMEGMDGFHCFSKDYVSTDGEYMSFESFKHLVEDILTMYAWDMEEVVVIDMDQARHAEHVLEFDMPSHEILVKWYEDAKRYFLEL